MYTAHDSYFSEIHISTQTFIMASLLLRMHSRKHEWACKQVAIRLRMFVLKLWNQYEVLSKAFQLKSLSKSPLFSQEGFFKRHKVWCSNAFKNVFDRKPPGKSFSVTTMTFSNTANQHFVSPLQKVQPRFTQCLGIKNETCPSSHTKHQRLDFLVSLEASSSNKTPSLPLRAQRTLTPVCKSG